MKTIARNQKGAILAISLLVIIILIILSVGYVARAVHEKAMADREVRDAKAIYAGEGGGHAGIAMLDTLINTNLLNTVNAASPAVVSAQAANYVATTDTIGFLVAYTKNGATALLTKTVGVAEAVYTGTSTGIDNSTYLYTIKLTPKGNPVTVAANIWDFPVYYRVQVTGANGSQSRKFIVNGDFTVRVQRDNFARYALFTNTQALTTGTAVWFTNSTNFTGPMFTNGKYNFARNPSGTFDGAVKQVSSTAQFYNNNNPVNLNNDHNGTIDVPTFNAGFTRNVSSVSLPSTSSEATMSAEASGGSSFGSNGIYVPNSSGHLTGGIYVKGDANSVTLSVNGSGNSVYTIVQGGTTKTITVNTSTNQTTVVTSGGGGTVTYTGQPKGVDGVGTILYVNGNINSLGGTVQQNNQMVIATHDDVVIQNHIQYSQKTAGSGTPGTAGYVAPTAAGAVNLLGLLSWNGDVRIGTSAPNNINIDGTVMAPAGIFAVDSYDTTAVRGTATVLGGVITNAYGGFGTFNSSTGAAVSGYGRNFVYDDRMDTQYTPPYFPTMNTFIAFTNDINDKKFWQNGGF